jgi:hypothetical protein
MMTQTASHSSSALLALVLASPFASPLLAQEKPVVAVEFRIEAPDFRRNLYKSAAAIEQDLARSLTALGADRFSFLRWQPLREIQDQARIAAILRVSLTAEEAKSLGSTVWLRFTAVPGDAGTFFSCADGEPASIQFDPDEIGRLGRPLFSDRDPQPTGNPKALKAAILGSLDEKFRIALAATFLSRIPFCHEAKPHVEGLVKIGMSRRDLDIAESSRMTLALCHRYQGRGRTARRLDMTTAIDTGIYLDGDTDPDKIQARIHCPADQAGSCLSEIPLILQSPLGTDLFMIDFKRRLPGTSGKRASSPAKS